MTEREATVFVVDDDPYVPMDVRPVVRRAHESDELIAHVDERHRGGAAPQLERAEHTLPERERLVDRPDLERDVVDPDQRHARSVEGTVPAAAV